MKQAGRLIVFAASLLVAGCEFTEPAGGGVRPFSGSRPIKALCTTGMVADIVRNIGGDAVTVEQLMGEGVDPHLYKPSTGDVDRLQSADVVFYSGLHLEGKLATLLERLSHWKAVYAVADGIPSDRLIPVGEGLYDPHVWFDVSLWKLAAERARDRLCEFDPALTTEYQARAARYIDELVALDAWVKLRIKEIPVAQRVLVTAHDAFQYFGRAYGVRLRSIQGISTDSEAGVKEINELVEFIADNGIKAVFVETSVNERNIRALVEGCRARGHAVRVGGELYSDAMGPPGTPTGTYAGMVRHNVNTIVAALK